MPLMTVESSFLSGYAYFFNICTHFLRSFSIPVTMQEARDSGGTQLFMIKARSL